MADNFKITLVRDKETKNTVRYDEQVEPTEHPVIRNVYLSKPAAAQLGNPEKITVTIESV